MATMNVSLPDNMKQWIQKQIDSGQYSNASDYVRSLIRENQEYRDKIAALRQALVIGEESGIAEGAVMDIWQKIKFGHGV